MTRNHFPELESLHWYFRGSGSSGWTVTHWRVKGRTTLLCGKRVPKRFKPGESPKGGKCLKCESERLWKTEGGGWINDRSR